MDSQTEEKAADEAISAGTLQNEAVLDEEKQDDADISFADLGLDEATLAAVARKGFVTPSPIQVLAIPRLLGGESNIIARARTGTGKTAAFGLPLIQKLREETGSVRALILEPTRELAIQTCTELQSFTEGRCPRTCVVYGGASYTTQIRDLRRGSEIVVGTPGRIQDHLERGTLDISKIEYFILDEGDEMLDMGFIEDIEDIFQQANPDSRILLFSATMPAPILRIAGQFMGDYEIVEEEGAIDEPLLIDQKFWVLKESEKIDALVRLIDISDDFYGIVFTQTKSDADHVSRALDEKGYEVAALHGDIAQSQREKIIARFRSKKTRVLVATDVAARGIDISGLSHVVNYSLPFDGATYVHRIGRTGRAGSEGTAVTFVCPNETRKLGFLQRAVRKASKGEMHEEPIPSIDEVLSKKRERLFAELRKKIGLNAEKAAGASEVRQDGAEEAGATPAEGQTEAGQSAEAQDAAAESAAPAEAAGAVPQEQDAMESSGAEAAEPDTAEPAPDAARSALVKTPAQFERMAAELCEGNDAQEVLAAVLSVMYGSMLDRSRYGKVQSRGNGGGAAPDPNQTRLYVQLGRRDGYNPREIADYFSGLLHIPEQLVDRIDVSTNFSLVSLPKEAARRALDLANAGGSVPHMHVDVREGGARRENSGGGYGGRRDRGFGGRDRKFGGRGDFGRGGFGHERGRDYDEGRRGGRGFKSRSSRPNFHTPTERSGSAGLYRSKRPGGAERF